MICQAENCNRTIQQTGRGRPRKYCCHACTCNAWREKRRGPDREAVCPYCERPFTRPSRGGSPQVYCCVAHQKAAGTARHRAAGILREGERRRARHRTDNGPHRRRAKLHGVPYEAFDKRIVFQRDDYTCQICGRGCQGTWPNPKSATLDHIVPISRGGPHSIENTQCACWSCNVRKGAGGGSEILPEQRPRPPSGAAQRKPLFHG